MTTVINELFTFVIIRITEMKERILEFLRAENKTSAQLAEEIGVQPSGISHIISGRNNPSLDFVIKMLEKYSYLSTDWLLFGKGNMYKDQTMHSLFEESEISNTGTPAPGTKKMEDSGEKDRVEDNKNKTVRKNKLSVEKIVWFYTDNSFREYFPDED